MGNVRIVEISTEITKVLRPGTKQIAQSRSSSHSDARKRPKRLRCGPPRAGQCIDHCGSRQYTLRDFAGKPRQGRQRAHFSERGGRGPWTHFNLRHLRVQRGVSRYCGGTVAFGVNCAEKHQNYTVKTPKISIKTPKSSIKTPEKQSESIVNAPKSSIKTLNTSVKCI